jgi:predicted amidohydrolase YtcJ
MVLPGFHDSHMHPLSGGQRLIRCRLEGARGDAELHEKVRACAAGGRGWLVGGGWDPRLHAPDREALDRLAGGRPAYLATADGHTAWVSSRALALAGIDDGEPGARAGIVTGPALSRIRARLPRPTPAQLREGLRRALALANQAGITSLIDGSADATILAQYRAADRAGELTARVLASQRVDGPEQVAGLVARDRSARGRRLRAGAAKIFVDGDLHDRSAALLASYPGGSDGTLRLPPAALAALVARLDAAGLQVHMHVMGDRAVRVALDALAGTRRDRRHQLAHLGLVDPADLPRLAALGVAANLQPLLVEGRADDDAALGPERARRLYPYRALVASGARLAAGSDWPAPAMAPLAVIQAALTREPPEERLALEDLLAAYTIGGAWVAHQEERTGSLEVGKAADVVVLERDLFGVAPGEIARVRVLLTLLDGVAVFSADAPRTGAGGR